MCGTPHQLVTFSNIVGHADGGRGVPGSKGATDVREGNDILDSAVVVHYPHPVDAVLHSLLNHTPELLCLLACDRMQRIKPLT